MKEKRKSIAELRAEQVKELAARAGEITPETMREATRIMNSYYRLCGLDERLLYLQNTPGKCDLKSTAALEEKARKWSKRLNAQLAQFNACIEYFGYLPTICEAGKTSTAVNTYFYKWSNSYQ